MEEDEAFLFCQAGIADFICGNLTRIRHTAVTAGRVEGAEGTGDYGNGGFRSSGQSAVSGIRGVQKQSDRID